MKTLVRTIVFSMLVLLVACGGERLGPQLTQQGVLIPVGTQLTVVLQKDLGSNISARGDTFKARLKKPLEADDVVVLPEGTVINGLVKRATGHKKLGDRASLLLIFDQIEQTDGTRVPFVSSLDTNTGGGAIKVQGKELKGANIVTSMAAIGGILGSSSNGSEGQSGMESGLMLGAMIGASAVLLSTREISLPVGTEVTISVEESILLPWPPQP